MKQADVWNDRYGGRHGASHSDADVWVSAYSDRLAEIKDLPIIDLGCGAGRNAQYLYNDGYRVIACDFSQAALALLKGRLPGIETRCFDMLDGLPFEDGGVGAVIASLSLHYFTQRDTERVVSDIYRTLARGGYLLVRVNSVAEYELKDKDDSTELIEPFYYVNKYGTPKRYFDAPSLTRLLGRFDVLCAEEKSGVYQGHMKYFVEALAHKPRAAHEV